MCKLHPTLCAATPMAFLKPPRTPALALPPTLFDFGGLFLVLSGDRIDVTVNPPPMLHNLPSCPPVCVSGTLWWQSGM